MHVERRTQIVKPKSKLQCQSQNSSDAYINVKGIIAVIGADSAPRENNNKKN